MNQQKSTGCCFLGARGGEAKGRRGEETREEGEEEKNKTKQEMKRSSKEGGRGWEWVISREGCEARGGEKQPRGNRGGQKGVCP